jgi:hypothetical protein
LAKDAKMSRPFALAALALVVVVLPVTASDTPAIERHIAVQKAMVTARQFLDMGMPAEAVTTLEAEISNADGNKAFLTLLREAYQAELTRVEKADPADTARITQIRRNLSLLGGVTPPSPKPPEVPKPAQNPAAPNKLDAPVLPSFDLPGSDTTADAVAAFNKRNYTEAARLFATAPSLTQDQKAAWVYCRVTLANDRLNAATCDAAAASAAYRDVTEALQLVPQHTELQKVGQQVLAIASQKAKAKTNTTVASSDTVVETASFRVRHDGNRAFAEAVAKAAETQRKTIFERWSGSPSGVWSPKCEIVIHPSADAFARATKQPAGSTGVAAVRLNSGHVTERRIDLRADDTGLTSNSLPRELTHVILADLFPNEPPPKWAQEGMAILATSPEEISRYTRTLPRCARDGEWFSLGQLMELKDFPADKITAFYCESVSLTEYLVRLSGNEKNFTIFLRDCQRYGVVKRLKEQYNIDGTQALEQAWKRSALDIGRGQGP